MFGSTKPVHVGGKVNGERTASDDRPQLPRGGCLVATHKSPAHPELATDKRWHLQRVDPREEKELSMHGKRQGNRLASFR